MLLPKGHAAINKKTSAAKPFWWPKLQTGIQQKCKECISCRLTGMSNNAQIPMTETIYLPSTEKPNQEIQLGFTGPIRFEHRRCCLLISVDRYSRWPAAAYTKHQTEKQQNF